MRDLEGVQQTLMFLKSLKIEKASWIKETFFYIFPLTRTNSATTGHV